LGWLGHTLRREPGHLLRRVADGRSEGTVHKYLEMKIKDDIMKILGLKPDDAQNRKSWKKWIWTLQGIRLGAEKEEDNFRLHDFFSYFHISLKCVYLLILY